MDGYELLITTDQNLPHQQNLADRRLAILVPTFDFVASDTDAA